MCRRYPLFLTHSNLLSPPLVSQALLVVIICQMRKLRSRSLMLKATEQGLEPGVKLRQSGSSIPADSYWSVPDLSRVLSEGYCTDRAGSDKNWNCLEDFQLQLEEANDWERYLVLDYWSKFKASTVGSFSVGQQVGRSWVLFLPQTIMLHPS